MHVTDPKRFPVPESATYRPHEATLASALSNAQKLDLPNLVFVQPSTYGTDNACLLEALKAVGPLHGRGVIVIDPEKTSLGSLQELHALGVRGVRLNLKSVGRQHTKDDLYQILRAYAAAVKPMKTWALQLYVDLAVLDGMELMLSELGVKVVLDHYGSPSVLHTDLSRMPGWPSLVKLMRSPLAYVKISAPYRLSRDPSYRNLEPITKELFQMRGGRGVVFASDWPHTRFEGVNVVPFVDTCLKWCEDDETIKNSLFRDNARELWDVE